MSNNCENCGLSIIKHNWRIGQLVSSINGFNLTCFWSMLWSLLIYWFENVHEQCLHVNSGNLNSTIICKSNRYAIRTETTSFCLTLKLKNGEIKGAQIVLFPLFSVEFTLKRNNMQGTNHQYAVVHLHFCYRMFHVTNSNAMFELNYLNWCYISVVSHVKLRFQKANYQKRNNADSKREYELNVWSI